MIQSLYNGASGVSSQQKNIDVIANNVANLNTDGFKRARFDFQDCLYLRMQSPVDNSLVKNLQRGAGTIEYQTARVYQQGVLNVTDRGLDFALEGYGFFMVENPAPLEENDGLDEILFTRSGSFYVTPEDEGGYLVDADGRYVLDADGERIHITNPSGLQVSPQGEITQLDESGAAVPVATLGIADFVNRGGLAAVGANYFMQTANSGDSIEPSALVTQGSLEGSNVDYAGEITRLVRAQRAYQLAARCITVADQMMQTANNIRQ